MNTNVSNEQMQEALDKIDFNSLSNTEPVKTITPEVKFVQTEDELGINDKPVKGD